MHSAPDGLKVQEDEDNRAVIHSVRDGLKLIQNKFLPAVHSWVQVRHQPGEWRAALARAGSDVAPVCSCSPA